jgi:invasion protein IalB
VCEVSQGVAVEGQQGWIAQVAVGRAPGSKELRLTVVLPTNISLQRLPKLRIEGKEAQAADLSWTRCVPGGCFASSVVSDDLMRRLRARTEPGVVSFVDAAEREITIPLSFRGLPQALDGLAKEQL